MIGKQDHVVEEIYKKVKYTIDNVFRSENLSSEDIKKYLSKKRNFNNFLKNFKSLKMTYEGKHEKAFEDKVREILDKVLTDRIYYEKDHPKNESLLYNYDHFLLETEIDPYGEENWNEKEEEEKEKCALCGKFLNRYDRNFGICVSCRWNMAESPEDFLEF